MEMDGSRGDRWSSEFASVLGDAISLRGSKMDIKENQQDIAG